jgi:hypothetical protein
MPKSQPRVPKSPDERIRDCETHLAFLREARHNYRTDRERYKQVAGELRVLVCKSRNNKPLLLDLMDEYGFNYEVQPAAPPAGPPLKGPKHEQLIKVLMRSTVFLANSPGVRRRTTSMP